VTEFREAANLLKTQGRIDEFVRVAERILYYQPDDQALGKELASCYLDRNNARAALARLKPSFDANRNDPEILDLVARCFEQLGQPQKSLSVLKELCRVYASSGRMAERNQIIQRALALDPNDPEIQAMLGRTMLGSGHAPALGTPVYRRVPTLSNAVTPTPVPSPRSTPITFGEMEVPVALQDQYATPPPDDGPSVADRMAIASGLVEKPGDDAEIQRILAEADIFVRYGLVERAAEHLRHVFERVPTHVGAHERLAAVLTQLGRKAEAAAELEVLAQQLLPSSRADAATYARRALEMNPGARRAQEVLAAADRMPPAAAAPAPVAARADAPFREEATPEPELIGSGEIELLGNGLPAGDEAADNTGAVAALAEAFGSAEDDGRVQAESDGFDEETTPATPADRPGARGENAVASRAPSSGSEENDDVASHAVLDDLAQVDFFIEQELNDEAQALLDELESRHPGHVLVADRRERLASLKKSAVPKELLAEKPTGRVEATPMPQAATGTGGGSRDLDSEADLGLMNKSMDRHDLAIAHFTALLGDPKREVFALTMIGDSHEAMGNHAEATRCFQDALRSTRATESEATQLYFLLGNVFYNTGDRAEALYYFERVAKRDPSFRDVQRRLAALKSRGGPH
jgi:tetratricopeptide (TPR) repeat protein